MRRTLEELPESLDETYERILKEIKKPNRDLARRALHCLVVAVRPLRVAELAEVLAVDFDDGEEIPKLNTGWRWEDQEQALLIACSSLIAIVEAGDVKASTSYLDVESEVSAGVNADDSRVVQFSHFSVKEFLTSSRLATASGGVSNHYIDLEPAHTILARTCLGVLLQIQDHVEGRTTEDHPLARYAAKHWTTHAQFGKVSSRLRKGMEYLFNPDEPQFKMWLTLYDIDTYPNEDAVFSYFALYDKSPASPLYYAALCGFHDLVKYLIAKHPQDVNADGGRYMKPILAALAGEYFEIADLLRHNGSDPHVRGVRGSPLESAAYHDNPEVVQKLIEYDADIDSKDCFGNTSLHLASIGTYFKDGTALRILLEHNADLNVQANDGETPLYTASNWGTLEAVRLLLKHGADLEVKNGMGRTALQIAAESGHGKIVELLREYGAK